MQANPGFLLRLTFLAAAMPGLGGHAVVFGQAVLAAGPYRVEDLGTVVESATLEHRILFRSAATGSRHLLLYFSGMTPFQILDLNLETGEARVSDAVPGRPGPGGTVLHSNGKVYIGSGDPGYFMVYDPATGKTQTIGKLADKGAQYAVEGDDGAIYIGETVKGYVERYDPATGALETLGIMDDPGPPYYRYAYTVDADGRYVYVGVGQMPWYLVIFDRETRTQKVYWKDLKSTVVNVQRGRNGGWFAEQCGTEDGVYRCKRYRLENGEPVPLAQGERWDLVPYSWRGNVLSDVTQSQKEFGIDIDLGDAVPDTGTLGAATVRWRSRSTYPWREASAKVKMYPYAVERLYPFSESELLAISGFYGPVLTYNPATRESIVAGRTQMSLYDAMAVDAGWYLAGYTAATLRWDPARPWALTASTPNRSDTSVNPYQLPGFHKYHYYLARGADGFVYVGVHHERDSVGGELGWYDPATDKRGSLRTPFEKHDVRHIIAADGGSRIVYSSVATEPGLEAKLFVFDVATKRVQRELTPVPGTSAYDKLVEVTPGIVLGVLGDRVFKVDIRTGEVLYARELGGQAFQGILTYDRRLEKGPDGYVWLYVDNWISRIRLADGTVERIVSAASPGSLVFFGNDLYTYGSTSLGRVQGLFAQ